MAVPSLAIIRTESAELSRVQDNVARSLNPVLSAVAATPIMGAAPPAWVALRSLTTAGFGGPAQYHVDALGYVHLRCSIVNLGGTITATTSFLLMPIGTRPKLDFANAAVLNSGTFISVRIAASGGVSASANILNLNSLDFYFSYLAEQ